MDFLKRHVRFIVVALVLVVVLWLANDELGGISQALEQKRSSAKNLLTQNYRALFADAAKYNGEPATTEGRRIQDKTQVIETVGAERNATMQFKTAPEYTMSAVGPDPAADDLLAYYNRKKIELQRELGYQRYFKEDAREDGALGFVETSSEKPRREKIVKYLRYLDIVRAIVHCVEDAGVAQLVIDDFDGGVDDALRQRGVPTTSLSPTESPFMSGVAIDVEIEATEESLYNFLIELQTPVKGDRRNRYLAIESFDIRKDDLLEPQDALVSATIRLIAYRVNPESSYPLDAEKQTDTHQQRRGPRTFR